MNPFASANIVWVGFGQGSFNQSNGLRAELCAALVKWLMWLMWLKLKTVSELEWGQAAVV